MKKRKERERNTEEKKEDQINNYLLLRKKTFHQQIAWLARLATATTGVAHVIYSAREPPRELLEPATRAARQP